MQTYVWACRMLGYEHPDLTADTAQVAERYASEEGLNLAALEEDCAALQAAATATTEALARQDGQLGALTAAWQGRGADASREFLRRHGEASALAAAAVRTAAVSLAELRDKLWQSVDGKVATVLSVQAPRADWLAAAETVTTGAGDRAVASELVDQEVKPFVANVIGGEWVAAMRAAVDAIEAAYDAVTAELASEGEAVFAVPGDLGPTWTPSGEPVVAPAQTVAPTAPAAWSGPAALAPAMGSSAAGPPPTALPPPAAAAPVDPAAAAPAVVPPSMPSLGGGGLSEMGSGLSGFAQQLGETLGGLLGSVDDAAAEPPELDEPELDEVEELEDAEDDADEDAEVADDVAVEPDTACEPAVEEPVPEEDQLLTEDAAAEGVPEPTPPPEPLPPPIVEPPASEPPADPAADAGTPCEIAADEVPQVGE
ncbi:hypothetical protein [Mycolicibacterium pulveris]|uniref:hypothetical protein n=1 Tax=Mycolicibacterium pulveris TaxID=36813 RepID=UPI003CEE808F